MDLSKKLLTVASLILIAAVNGSWEESKPVSESRTSPAPRRITIAAVGDTVMHMPIVNSVYNGHDGVYDFRPIFTELKESIADSDFAVGVLETVIAPGEPLSGYPRFNSPGAIADALKWAGLDLVFVAHNHSLDKGISGLQSTLAYLDKIGLPYAGGRRENRQKSYYLVNLKGVKLAFLSYTTSTNGNLIPKEYTWAVNLLDLKKVSADIADAKRDGADGIVLGLHTGIEYQREPSEEQQALVGKLFELGADIIIGSHVHVIQPFQFVGVEDPVSRSSRICFVAYSIGNLLSNQRWRYSDCGLLLKIDLEKLTDQPGMKIISVSHTPLWVNRFIRQGRVHYHIKMINGVENIITDLDPDLDDAARKRMKEVWYETEELENNWNQRRNPPHFSASPGQSAVTPEKNNNLSL